jgi:hypothetical protein
MKCVPDQTLKKYPLLFGLPAYFCENFPNGAAKKKYKAVLDFIFCVNDSLDFDHCFALALADAGNAVCVYVLCTGDEYHLSKYTSNNGVLLGTLSH